MTPRTLTEAVLGVPDVPMTPEEEGDLAERIDIVLHTLDPREAFLLRRRYLRRPPTTLGDLATLLGVSSSRASQIEARALRKLRIRWRASHLRPGISIERTLGAFRGGAPAVPPAPVLEAADLPADLRPRLVMDIASLPLGVRARAVMDQLDLVFVGDLVRMTETQLLRCKNFGRKSLREVKDALAAYGLELGGAIEGWDELRARAMAARPMSGGCPGPGSSPVIVDRPCPSVRSIPSDAAPPTPVDALRPEVARAVLNRLLAVRPELRDLAQRLSESVIAVLEDERAAAPAMRPAPSTPEPTSGG